ncbi:hypothetical protein BKA61DRAFT_681262 [Leptodontidium sp. MPI-SDFR-AT-0119]|nr:hypothetical protein BKA61DRAFT_681262 [Leptodontidium sp. MPI-SDFR-AT-0119]
MVSQTRGMARSAARSAFINFQSQRHPTRSVVRTTNIFKSLPEDAPPPPIPQPRTRKRRAPEPEQEEGRPAKRRQRAARAAAPVPAPAPAPSPSPPPANLSPPPVPTQYIPAPVPSPTTTFPLRRGQGLKPRATPAQVLEGRNALSMWRYDLYGRIPGSAHHEPRYLGPAKLTPADWELEVPDRQEAATYRDDRENERTASRRDDIFFEIRPSPNDWLKKRMKREGNPENELQRARRLQLAIDKRDYMADGSSLSDPDPAIYRPWNGSTLAYEFGWEWREGNLYTRTRPA